MNYSLWSDCCNYVELDKCENLNPTNKNLIVVQLNICSLLAHHSELIHLLATLEQKNSKIDILLLCETFLTTKTASLVNISG